VPFSHAPLKQVSENAEQSRYGEDGFNYEGDV
jgi:hypothetical protein